MILDAYVEEKIQIYLEHFESKVFTYHFSKKPFIEFFTQFKIQKQVLVTLL
jgi:hypothetical protein